MPLYLPVLLFLVVLAAGLFKYSALLKRGKVFIRFRMRARPVLKGRKVLHRAEQPLGIRIKQAFLQQLAVVLEQPERKPGGIVAVPVKHKPRADHR